MEDNHGLVTCLENLVPAEEEGYHHEDYLEKVSCVAFFILLALGSRQAQHLKRPYAWHVQVSFKKFSLVPFDFSLAHSFFLPTEQLYTVYFTWFKGRIIA